MENCSTTKCSDFPTPKSHLSESTAFLIGSGLSNLLATAGKGPSPFPRLQEEKNRRSACDAALPGLGPERRKTLGSRKEVVHPDLPPQCQLDLRRRRREKAEDRTLVFESAFYPFWTESFVRSYNAYSKC